MKKLGILMMFFALVSVNALVAQGKDGKPNKEEMAAKKVAFITEKLALTSDEAKEFWPVFDEMQAKIKANHKEFKANKPGKDVKIDDMSDAEVKKMMDDGFLMKEKDLEIKKEYNDKFIEIIGVKRTAKLQHMHHEFKKEHKKEGAGPGGHPPVKGGEK